MTSSCTRDRMRGQSWPNGWGAGLIASARARAGQATTASGDQTTWSNTGKSCFKVFRILVDHLGKEVVHHFTAWRSQPGARAQPMQQQQPRKRRRRVRQQRRRRRTPAIETDASRATEMSCRVTRWTVSSHAGRFRLAGCAGTRAGERVGEHTAGARGVMVKGAEALPTAREGGRSCSKAEVWHKTGQPRATEEARHWFKRGPLCALNNPLGQLAAGASRGRHAAACSIRTLRAGRRGRGSRGNGIQGKSISGKRSRSVMIVSTPINRIEPAVGQT